MRRMHDHRSHKLSRNEIEERAKLIGCLLNEDDDKPARVLIVLSLSSCSLPDARNKYRKRAYIIAEVVGCSTAATRDANIAS